MGPSDPRADLTRTVDVPVRRLEAWLAGFARRHHGATCARLGPGWLLTAGDGDAAYVEAPDWLLADASRTTRAAPESSDGPAPGAADPVVIPSALRACPVLGVLLVRRAGYAVALLRGEQLVAQKVGSRHIHGRTAAGGWSQQRYARRRANQADEVAAAAGRHAQELIGPHLAELDVLVTGGDPALVAAALQALHGASGVPAGARPARRSAGPPPTTTIPVGTPTRRVLTELADRVLAVSIRLAPVAPEERP